MTQPEPELTPEQLERAVDALEALMRPKLRALVQRRYGMVGVELHGSGRATVITRETAPPGESIYEQGAA
jgi:hypothetical protein